MGSGTANQVGGISPRAATILVVDDHDVVLAAVGQLLRRVGYHVIEADGALEALRAAEHCREFIHLLLTDIDMPGMNGVELADRMRGLRPGMKILFMSGLRKPAGIDDQPFLAKPFTIAQLSAKVSQVLSAGDLSSCPPAPPPSAVARIL
jgi:CheY-like chemotaxis protein